MSDLIDRKKNTERETYRTAYILHKLTGIEFGELCYLINKNGIENTLDCKNFHNLTEEQRKALKEVKELLDILGGTL